ncbi:MAG TPA: LysM peptidoglycan-binding domain-containing protein [Anaerolineales bacterium]|nr:LysM peptidoglycan-binding domain-containing protein [Anaerolineales bacterium]
MGSVRRSGNRGFFLYLLLNVIVSAATVLGVLALWGRRTGSPPPEATPRPTPTIDAASVLASVVPTATETLVPTATPYVYRVRPDDSLFGIALELGVSLSDLMELNDLNENSILEVGQVLLVPTPSSELSIPSPTASPGPSATMTPAQAVNPQVAIIGVSGVGDLAEESVEILNSGGVAAMAGWTLRDDHGNSYVFPALNLHRGALRIYTRGGTDSSIELYWGLDQPLWSAGSTITLQDAAGTVQSTFTIPTP